MESESVDLTISVPDMVRVWAHPHVRDALHEVLENAIKHSDRDQANVEVEVERTAAGDVKLTVTDDGPHVPTNEIAALDRMEEQPLTHSDGLGLWYAKLAATTAGGNPSIKHLDERGFDYGSFKAKTPPFRAGIQPTGPPLTMFDGTAGDSTPSRYF
jgi:K+-sensing histidine kinase KdpD